MDERLFPFIIQPYAPEEIIVFFHLANDFQTITQPESGFPYYIIDGDGNVTIHPDDDDAHLVIDTYWSMLLSKVTKQTQRTYFCQPLIPHQFA